MTMRAESAEKTFERNGVNLDVAVEAVRFFDVGIKEGGEARESIDQMDFTTISI